MHRFLLVSAAALALTLAGCSNPVGENRLPPPDPTQISYATSLNINLAQFTRTTSGVYYQDQTAGTGAVISRGDSVSVGYTGWLANGTQFDTNQPSGSPFRFRVGGTGAIQGFSDGVVGMRVGGTRRIVIPSTLAYGRVGVPNGPVPIPSNAVLVFSIVMSQRF